MENNDFIEHTKDIANLILKHYWLPLYKHVEKNQNLVRSVTGFLFAHDKLVFYFGKTHLAIEYFGSERIRDLYSKHMIEFECHDLTLSNKNFIEQIIGFEFDSTSKIKMPLPNFTESSITPTNKGFDKLEELKWNFDAQNSRISFNSGNFYIPEGEFSRHINSLYFDADEQGLRTRHIKWIDFIPLKYDDTDSEYDKLSINLSWYNEKQAIRDAHYEYPLPNNEDYKISKLNKINRFIEIVGNKKNSEIDITSFLEEDENKFILSMAFSAKEIYPQLTCEWQNENKNSLKPDFFIVQPNGFADIIEFKLPYLKSSTVKGISNRETFSAELNSYISQTRVYKKYFDDSINRKWFEKKYGFKVLKPKRVLIVGRRWEFKNDDWKDIIDDYKDIEIRTYEDLIDGVVAQLYL